MISIFIFGFLSWSSLNLILLSATTTTSVHYQLSLQKLHISNFTDRVPRSSLRSYSVLKQKPFSSNMEEIFDKHIFRLITWALQSIHKHKHDCFLKERKFKSDFEIWIWTIKLLWGSLIPVTHITILIVFSSYMYTHTHT